MEAPASMKAESSASDKVLKDRFLILVPPLISTGNESGYPITMYNLIIDYPWKNECILKRKLRFL